MPIPIKPPKRLRIKRFCSIDGIRKDRRLKAGLYETGKNLSEEEANILSSVKFAHCVEILEDAPAPEPLARDTELPIPDPAYMHIERRRADEARARAERWDEQPESRVGQDNRVQISAKENRA